MIRIKNKKRHPKIIPKKLSVAIAASTFALVSPSLLAQEEKDNLLELEEITVTAQRRAQSLQDASVSISAISGDNLSSMGINDSFDLNGAVPGLQIAHVGGQVQTFVRGVGDTTSNAYTQASVAVNMDGVYVARSGAFRSTFFDVERVEVLRGPQGTLYGRNASGGAINVITKDPSFDEVDGFLSTDLGNYDLVQIRGGGNIIFSDTLAARLSSQIIDREGYLSDGSSDNKAKAVRLKVLWEPSEDFKMKTSFETAHIGGRGPGRVNRPDQFGDPWEAIVDERITSEEYPSRVVQPDPVFLDTTSHSLSSELVWDFESASLTVIPAYRYFESDYALNSRSRLPETDRSEQYSLEARVGGDNEHMTWVAGAYGFQEDLSTLLTIDGRNEATQSGRFLQQDIPVMDTEAWAIFGETTFKFTDTLRAILGLRYTEETRIKQGTITSGTFAAGELSLNEPFDADTDLDEEEETWKLGLEYDVADDVMLFFTAAEGFKSGGFDVSSEDPFFPEYVTAYTLGAKSQFGRLQLNLEAFYWEYEDQQVSFLGPNNDGAITFITRNAGSSTIQGLSAEGIYLFTENIKLTYGLEYLDATYDEFSYNTVGARVDEGDLRSDGCVSGGTVQGFLRVRDCSGLAIPRSPELSGNLSYEHDFPLNSGAVVTFLSSMKYADEQFLTASNFSSEYHQEDGYTTFDTSLTYQSAAVYIQASDNSNVGPLSGTVAEPNRSAAAGIAPPRTYGIKVKYKF